MITKRIQFKDIVQNQLPSYVREEFPLVSEFLSQYYLSQEVQGSPTDIIQNIDQYIKIDETTNLVDSVFLGEDISFLDTVIKIDLSKSINGYSGIDKFPDSYGLLKINDEIITYTQKVTSGNYVGFSGCIRGFSGITSLKGEGNTEELVFSDSNASEHSAGSTITNLSSLFLKEFLYKTKYQLAPGFEGREFSDKVNERLVLKQIKDFYSSKGTDKSFEILFKILYGEDAKVVKPKDHLFRPSDSSYRVTDNLVVESISGDPLLLENSTLFQDEYGTIKKSYAPISNSEKIISDDGRVFYVLKIDSGYDRDIQYNGSVYGEFVSHPKTKVIGNISAETATIDVDSTLGFPSSGELYVVYSNGLSGVISYSSKNINQFLGCSGISDTILDASDLFLDTYAYGYTIDGDEVRVRISSVINGANILGDTKFYSFGDSAKIRTLGTDSGDKVVDSLIHNSATTYEVISSQLLDASDNTYSLLLNKDHIFRIGDTLLVDGSDSGSIFSEVIDINSSKKIIIRGQGLLSLNRKYFVRKNILKANTKNFEEVNDSITNIQNSYLSDNKSLIASPSIPYYGNQKLNVSNGEVVFSGKFFGDTFKITSGIDHGFYTGDLVYYTPEISTREVIDIDGSSTQEKVTNSFLFVEGLYFVKRIDSNNIKLSRSRSDIDNSIFVSLETEKVVSNNKIIKYHFNNKTLEPQKLFREISNPVNDGKVYKTNPGKTGILINGVEILNYKSTDTVYHGKIESIDVISGGEEYDIINPPQIEVTDKVGTGASVHCSVLGSLSQIRVIDPGFDYIETPIIKITGGNGTGAKASANMRLVDHVISFKSDLKSEYVSIGTNFSTIGFSTYHKLRNGEKVIYNSYSQQSVGGLDDNSIYYISKIDDTTLKIHKTEEDAISGINTVTLSSYGIGEHSFRTFNKKKVVSSISVVEQGSGYENKKRIVNYTGINTSSDYIEIENHGYKSGEKVKYQTSDVVVGGLTNNNVYYVTKIDNDKFRLSDTFPGDEEFYYRTKQFIDFTSQGTGKHTFNYPEITVELIGNVGISTIGNEDFKCKIQPIFRGEISSIHLENKGSGYGSNNILNYLREPNINVVLGSNAQLTPIVNDGKITQVLINNSGKNYYAPPNLIVNSEDDEGTGAVLVPVVRDGQIVDVKIIQGGINYTQGKTEIAVSVPSTGSKFKANLQTWTINLFEKEFNKITDDDGFLTESYSEKYGIQYTNLYAPRKLREILYSVDSNGNVLYGKKDLRISNRVEVSSDNHSPIIGWAYDGNPIYGPYGYIKKDGGIISQMKSGYKTQITEERPSLSEFPLGFFVEDYFYENVNDDTVLDKNNGRYCVTPEFPNGTYAYFATINTLNSDSSGPFRGYKRPVFPYIIGDEFYSRPNEFNFKSTSNQDEYSLEDNNWIRNTKYYNLTDSENTYRYINLPNNLNQSINVKSILPGKVESVSISTSGFNYRVNDELRFESLDRGFGATAKVEKIKGKEVNFVSVATSAISNVEIFPDSSQNGYVLSCENPHSFTNFDLVSLSGFNTTSSLLEGIYSVGVSTNKLSLVGVGTTSTGISSSPITGIVTYFSVLGNISNIRENDVYRLNSEKIKVLNIDRLSSRLRVLREVNGTVGTSHSVTNILYEESRRLRITKSGIRSDYSNRRNKEIYFDPSESIGLGTNFGVGIVSSIIFSNPGLGITSIDIPTKSIYIPNHQLQTGDRLEYHTNVGTGISVSTTGISSTFALQNEQIVYVAKITDDLIGISTVRVGLDTTGNFVGISSTTTSSSTLYFTGFGTGIYHSFRTIYPAITANISRNIVNVSTASTHGLSNGDEVNIKINPGLTTTYYVSYSDYNRRLLLNAKEFVYSGINTTSNAITIQSHGFITGQKVVYTTESTSSSLQNNKIYYVVKIDDNTIKLSQTEYDSVGLKPKVVGISTSSGGTLSMVNPPIDVYRDSTIIFDLSDSSLSYTSQSTQYSAFDFNIYKDPEFTDIFNSSEQSSSFEVKKNGRIGITSTARLTLSINEYSNDKLYYNLVPIFEGNTPKEKIEIQSDSLVKSNNQINVKTSNYSGTHKITTTSSNTFTYPLRENPESSVYYGNISKVEYNTSSLSAYGPISSIVVKNGGSNYYSLPGITTIVSNSGYGAVLESQSNSIGRIKNIKVDDIGFDFPVDKTLKPKVSLPKIVKIESLSSFDSIGITSYGRGYSSPPKLNVFDGKTNKKVSDVDLIYKRGDSEVTILKNTYGINQVTPVIIPTENSNGVGISSIEYNNITQEVTVKLSVGFSTADSFPFAVSDKVLIENINVVGSSTTIKGYNSENYNYRLFELTAVDENRGGIGSVTYSMSGILTGSQIPGIYDPRNSFGRIIPQKYFPTFDIKLKTSDYIIGEGIESENSSGIVGNWNPNTGYLTVITKDDFAIGDTLQGRTSKNKGVAVDVISAESFADLSASSKVENGWTNTVGFLNDELERIPDNFYYQNFSYSIKSKVDYDTWEDVVGALNHTVGYKKFSDYQLESRLDGEIGRPGPLTVGISSNLSSFEIVTDLVGYANLHCDYNFDLVKENNLPLGSRLFSNEVTFSNRILTDYSESVGNRVLFIDDLNEEFNSNPRPTRYVDVSSFILSTKRSSKYLALITDRRFYKQRQLMNVTIVHDGQNGYINQYGRMENTFDLGSFDFGIVGINGYLRFYPTKATVNNYHVTTLSYNLNEDVLSVGNTSFGGICLLNSSRVLAPESTQTNIVGISKTYSSAKILVEIKSDSESENGDYEFTELNVIHDGTDVHMAEYGQITTKIDNYPDSGFGTFSAYIDGSLLKIDFIPNAGIGTTAVVSTAQIAIADSSYSGIGTIDIKYSKISAKTTNISSSPSPSQTVIANYPDEYDGAYFIVQVSDTSNNTYQFSELSVIDDYEFNNGEYYITEYGTIETVSGLGTFGMQRSASYENELTFTPIPDINVDIKVYTNALRHEDDLRFDGGIDLNNLTIDSGYERYNGTEFDIKRSFNLTHQNEPIFERYFDGSSPFIVDIIDNTIQIPNHFFVTGEKVLYRNAGAGTTQAISIYPETISGIGLTDKIPEEVYIVKISESKIQLTSTAEKALKAIPEVFDIVSVGIGNSHRITSTNQNSKAIVTVDNVIQSPIVSTSSTTRLSDSVLTTDDTLYFDDISELSGGDFVKIGNELMRIDGVGIGSTNAILVRRPWMGTVLAGYSTGELVTKVNGNYNIIDNTLNFASAPYGKVPIISPTSEDSPDERDWIGIETSSSFHGRVFLRSGTVNSSNETYSQNYIFDDISSEFNGTKSDFTLKSLGADVSGISNQNAIVLVNDIFQGPGLTYDYVLEENVGVTSITFTGTASSTTYDINTANIPLGGIIVSVGSTEGFGYQPLVSAGGTALVSIAGTISSISIGNSGSGYRSGIQTVRVGVQTYSSSGTNIEYIGIASITNGNITTVAITTVGSGYTYTNPPIVIFDDPLSYSDLPLVYSSPSTGIGTQATIDIVVSQDSTILDFEIKNTGYSYKNGEILTIITGGPAGIPTTSEFATNKFEVTIQETFSDKFTGWSIGELQTLDNIENLFDGEEFIFPLTIAENPISIRSAKGSNINVQDTLLVFVNDILQVPGKGYIFEGGSVITFTEPPKEDDTCKIYFYRGSGDIDVVERDILETVKVGDDIIIGYDPSVGQSPSLQEESRSVTRVKSTDLIETNPYFGPGNTTDETLTRPVVWCKQTEDKIIDEKEIGKDRPIYEPRINPFGYLISTVGIGSTIVYIDNLKPFFDQQNENDISLEFQNSITFISQDEKVGASATAVVSAAGTVSSIIISNSGNGYLSLPQITIQTPVGGGTTAIAGVTGLTGGTLNSIVVTSPGTGYTTSEPPIVLIEPPSSKTEIAEVQSYSGDSGIIVGFGTTTISGGNKLILDLYVPRDSSLKTTALVGTAITISSLSQGDYFMVFDSNVSLASTEFESTSLSGSRIGISTQFIDNVYQVYSSEIIEKNVPGIGNTYINRILTNVTEFSEINFSITAVTFDSTVYTFDSVGLTTYSGGISTSNYFGNFSWGRIQLETRTKNNEYVFDGYSGISGIPNSTLVRRTTSLKYSNYIV